MLSATYKSLNNEPFTHVVKLRAPLTDQTLDRTAYLGSLRQATAELQDRINTDLTARMEEDKVREAEGKAGGAKVNGAVDEAKEEDNYGEEVEED